MVGLGARYDISERLIFLLDTSFFRNQTNNDDFITDDDQRSYYEVHPRLRWKLTRWWDVTASYRYRHQKYDGDDDSAESNAVYLSLTYNWPRESVARWSEI